VRRNRLALDSLALRARVLRDVNHVDASTTRLGRKLRLPVLLAPVGSIESFDPGGGATIVRAAGEFGVAHMLSSVCKPHLEGVADAAPDATRIYQLYVRSDAAATDAVVRRVIDRGYRAFCMTVDSAVYSRRERDLAKRHRTAGRLAVEGRNFQAALAWDTVKRVRDSFDIPIVLKGIQTAEDALLAVEHGVEWIYVSNHGGRQLDHGQGSMEVLPSIVEAVKGRAKIIVDGGFCRGTDIVKAIAAGADLVGLGRMQCFAVAAAGQAGVVRMLELLEDEVQRCLMLVGAAKLADLDRSFLAPTQPVNLPHVLSAFPLLEIERYRY
jgi:glycolate oxidase